MLSCMANATHPPHSRCSADFQNICSGEEIPPDSIGAERLRDEDCRRGGVRCDWMDWMSSVRLRSAKPARQDAQGAARSR